MWPLRQWLTVYSSHRLRKVIISALFNYPDDPATIKLAGTLWAETTYGLIERYRQLVSEMRNKVATAGPTDRMRTNGRRPRFAEGQEGPVALRKLLKRFTGFLSDEEKFWTQLFLQFARIFNIREASSSIVALSLMATDPDDLIRNTRDAVGPPNLSTEPLSPNPTPAVKEHRLLQLHKCLISLGDLARYRTLAKEPTAQPTSAPNENRRNRNPVDLDFSLSAEFYRQAHLLLPTDGNPSNQLAIIAMRAENHFDAALHYYRAICVERSFLTSNGNLLRWFAKNIDAKRSQAYPEGSTDRLKWQILDLHAYWHLRPTSVSSDRALL